MESVECYRKSVGLPIADIKLKQLIRNMTSSSRDKSQNALADIRSRHVIGGTWPEPAGARSDDSKTNLRVSSSITINIQRALDIASCVPTLGAR